MSDSPGGRRRSDDDLPPSRSEADAGRSARAMPLVWMVVGLIVVAGFVIALLGGRGFLHGGSAGPGPAKAQGSGSSPALASGAQPR